LPDVQGAFVAIDPQDGAIVAMRGFGASAPADRLFEHFGFTEENVAATVQAALARRG
jgi:transketolase